jgi:hypothetical protein
MTDRNQTKDVLGVLLVVAAIAFIFMNAVAAPALAQPGAPANNTTNATGGANATANVTDGSANGTANGTANGSANGSANGAENGASTNLNAASDTGTSSRGSPTVQNGGGGGLLSPGKYFNDLLVWITEEIRSGVVGFIDSFNNIVGGIPAPGTLDNFERNMITPISPLSGTYNPPQNLMWPAVAATVVLSSWITIPILFLFLLSTFAKTPAEQRDMVPRALLALFLTFFAFPFLALYLHGMDAIVMALTPSGQEFVSSPEGIAKFGIGAIFGAGLIIGNSTLAGVAIVVLVVFYVAFHVVVMMWPWAMLAWAAPSKIINYVAYAEFAALVGLPVLRIIQALIARVLFEMDLAPITNGAVESAAGVVVSTLFTCIGLFLAYYYIPKVGMDKIIPAINMPVGQRAQKRAGEVSNKARERVPSADELHEKVFTARGGDAGESGTTPRSVGGVSNSRSSGAMVGSPSADGSDAQPVAESGTRTTSTTGTSGTTARDESGMSPSGDGLDADNEQKRIARQRRGIGYGSGATKAEMQRRMRRE